jgi:hypothetical protein
MSTLENASHPKALANLAKHLAFMMSDGVWKFIDWETIIKRCGADSGQELISSLRDVAAKNTGGALLDDFSLILIES